MEKTETIHRIGGCQQEFLESLKNIGPVYFQARNGGGGLGCQLRTFRPLLIPDMTYAVDPDAGVAFSLDEYISTHFIKGAGAESTERLDLEFSCFPAGISIISTGPDSKLGDFDTMSGPREMTPVTKSNLERWRKDLGVEHPVCDCCQKAAQRRSENPKGHPLHALFRQVIDSDSALRIQLYSDHVDLIFTMHPRRLNIETDHLILLDDQLPGILHLNIRMVHAVQIEVKRIDDEIHSTASVYDSHGNRNFQFTTTGSKAAIQWNTIFTESAMNC